MTSIGLHFARTLAESVCMTRDGAMVGTPHSPEAVAQVRF